MQLLRLAFDNLRRNLLRTGLTCAATMILVLVITLVMSILWFLDFVTREKSANFKGIVSEKWRIPSQMPYSYAAGLSEGNYRNESDLKPDDSMTWTFFFGSISKDPKKRTFNNGMFAFCMEPSKIKTMLDGADQDSLEPSKQSELYPLVDKLQANKQGVIIGRDRMEALRKDAGNLQVGDRITVYSINYKDIDLELEILGLFPLGVLEGGAVIHRDYFVDSLDAYKRKNGKPHPLAEKALNLVWFKVPDRNAFNQIAGQIIDGGSFSSPAVKVETASSGISTFLDAYRDLLWYFRWVLAPAILVIVALVISIAISIGVRERRMEFAVLKVLGFQPWQLLLLVLIEAIAIGVVSGTITTWATYAFVNLFMGGFKFPIAFFGAFKIPFDALWWGPVIGASTALIGSLVPAWSAQRVKVAEVFSRVT